MKPVATGRTERRPCRRCRKMTWQVHDHLPPHGWYCCHCVEFHADPRPPSRRPRVVLALIVLAVLAAKAILTWVPSP